MTDPAAAPISGFQAELALWAWSMVVLLHGLARSYGSPRPDPLRPPGPPE